MCYNLLFADIFEFPTVFKLRLSVGIYVLVHIPSIFALALSVSENSVFTVSPFYTQDRTPFHRKSLERGIMILYHK